jgi:hypothetical protein
MFGVKMVRTSGLTAIHPGQYLAEILAERGASQAAFARAIGVSPMLDRVLAPVRIANLKQTRFP